MIFMKVVGVLIRDLGNPQASGKDVFGGKISKNKKEGHHQDVPQSKLYFVKCVDPDAFPW